MAPGMPKPKLTEAPGRASSAAPAGDDRAHAEVRRLGRGPEIGPAADLAADGGVVGAEIGLRLVGHLHHGVDQDARQRHLSGGHGAARHDPADLRHDPAAAVVGGQRGRHHVEIGRLVDQAEIAAPGRRGCRGRWRRRPARAGSATARGRRP